MKQITLLKGHERYVFRYDDPAALLLEISQKAADETDEFSWYDAAVMSYQMGLKKEHGICGVGDG